MKRLTTEQFIEKAIKKAKSIHGDKYDYSNVKYVNHYSNVKIICKTHGIFEQLPSNHIKGCGCPICSSNKKLTNGTFIKKAKLIHGDKYDYSNVKYNNINDKVIISCKKYNHTFKQSPNNQLRGRGCLKCKSSKYEDIIKKYLINNTIEFIPQKIFNDCKNILHLPFDFYLPNHNTCIEFDGHHHFKPINWSGKLSKTQLNEPFKKCNYNDKIKTKYCKQNNIRLIRISYKENVEQKLKEFIK